MKTNQDFVRGLHAGEKSAAHEIRIAQFGAIRRAAASAREWDALGNHLNADYAHKIAEEIRNTIRASIASWKTSA